MYAWSHLASASDLVGASAQTAPGLLAGVPFGVKDIIDVAGMPTRCGSEACTPRRRTGPCINRPSQISRSAFGDHALRTGAQSPTGGLGARGATEPAVA
ncbi:amidase family protein [Paraburkholderia fungorum]|uniref:amidase family protein n=1 Tax=Paraburkholderia fungorum TaxID=134537 RepID=UPI0038B7FD58